MGKGTGAKLVKTETFNVSPSFKSNLAKVFGLDEKKIPDTLELPSTKKIPGLKPKKKGGIVKAKKMMGGGKAMAKKKMMGGGKAMAGQDWSVLTDKIRKGKPLTTKKI